MRASEPVFVDLAPEMKERLEKFRQEHQGEELGNVATRLLLEDDNVKIWEMVLEPGEHSDLHRHDHDYYMVIMSGDHVAGIPPVGDATEPFVGAVPAAGNTVFWPKDTTPAVVVPFRGVDGAGPARALADLPYPEKLGLVAEARTEAGAEFHEVAARSLNLSRLRAGTRDELDRLAEALDVATED